MQNPTEIPNSAIFCPVGAFSPASSSRLLRIACNAASEPRRQAGDRSIVRTLRPLAAGPGGVKRGESWVFLLKLHGESPTFHLETHEDHWRSLKIKARKIYGKHVRNVGVDLGVNNSRNHGWAELTQKPDMFDGVTKMVEITWGVFWPKLDGLTMFDQHKENVDDCVTLW